MVKVAAYRTSDLKCHEVESVALKHEFLLEQRAFFNKHMKRDSYTILEITACIGMHREEFTALCNKYEKSIARAVKKETVTIPNRKPVLT